MNDFIDVDSDIYDEIMNLPIKTKQNNSRYKIDVSNDFWRIVEFDKVEEILINNNYDITY